MTEDERIDILTLAVLEITEMKLGKKEGESTLDAMRKNIEKRIEARRKRENE